MGRPMGPCLVPTYVAGLACAGRAPVRSISTLASRLQREAVLPPVRPAISVAGFMVLGLAAGALWRQFLERLKLPLQPGFTRSGQPSLQQVIGVLQRVDPALGNLAETVSQVWGLLQSELAEQLTEDASGARSGRLLLHLFALGRLKSLQSAGFDLPVEQVPLVSDLPQLTEAYRLTKLAVASYGDAQRGEGANVLALVGLLQFKDAWPSAGPDRDRVAAARYLEVPVERMLAYGTLGDSRKESEEPKSALERFKPWWILMEDGDELILSIRGSANIDDIATDLACATCEFLHGYAHEGVAGAVSAVWDEAESEVAKAIQARDYQRLVVCGHSLGGAVSLLLGMKLRATNALPLEVHAFAAGPPPAFQGESRPLEGPELEEGLISVINRFDPVPHLSLDAALRMVLAAEKLADEGLSWQQTLGLVVGTNEFASPKFDDLIAKIPKQAKAPLRIPGEAIWLVDACAGRQVLAVDLRGRLQDFVEELPEISVAQSALDHVSREQERRRPKWAGGW
ncbi:Lipase_3 domain-containing protein [Durusdinium trenchii]|uniref:sn-1-specific diacylglycerol lipase n=1 Tax=Durusdinium trenchii TaxID=1381693 RepID=A0ABP0KZ66_9DINO